MDNFSVQSRSLDKFKSKLTGGGARANLFECNIPIPSWVEVDGVSDLKDKMRMLVKTAALPASNIGTIPIPFRGRVLNVAGDRTFESWTVTVINDTDFAIRRVFEKWMNGINRHSDTSGYLNPSDYQLDIEVSQLGRAPFKSSGDSGNVPILRTYKLYGCFPTSVGSIPLSYDDTDSIEQYDVTFEIQWWEAFKGSKTSDVK